MTETTATENSTDASEADKSDMGWGLFTWTFLAVIALVLGYIVGQFLAR